MKRILLSFFGLLVFTETNAQAWELMDTIPNFKPEEAAFMTNFYYLAGFYSAGSPSIMKSIDQGETWQDLTENLPNPNAEISGIHFRNDNEGAVCSKSGAVYYTIDGGSNWSPGVANFPLVSGEFLSGVYFMNSLTGFVSVYNTGSNPNLWKTTDGGNIWSPVSIGSNASLIGIKGRNNTVFVYTGGNAAIKSFDGGNTWQIDYLNVGGSVMSDPNFISDTTMLVGGGGGAYLIEDSLSTAVLSNNLGGTFASANAVNDSDNWFVAGQNLNIFFTADGGQNYSNRPLAADPNFLGTSISNANFNDVNRPIVAGYTTNMIGFGLLGFIYKWNPTATPVGLMESGTENIKIYPNPTTSVLNIENAENATIRIFDNTGKLVQSMENHPVAQISVVDLEKGFYFLEMEKNGTAQTTRFVKE